MAKTGGGAVRRIGTDTRPVWRFRWTQLRVLLLALVVGAIAWGQLLGEGSAHHNDDDSRHSSAPR